MGGLNGWTAERAKSYLREYNDYVLQILNIHRSNTGSLHNWFIISHLVLLRLFFGNGAMIVRDGPYILKNDVGEWL
jgi:hypothetical protein